MTQKTVSIYTYADKRPDFIDIQATTFKQFVKDKEWKFTVFNNGSSPVLINAIEERCKEHGLECIKVENPNHSNPNYACAYPIKWSWENYLRHNQGITVFLDSDMFLLKGFSFVERLGNLDIIALKQKRGHVAYISTNLVILNTPNLPEKETMNWWCDSVEGFPCDVGGQLYPWLKKHKNTLKIEGVKYSGDIATHYGNLFCLPREIRKQYRNDFYFQTFEDSFFHYKRGSNWDGKPLDFQVAKSNLAYQLIEGCKSGIMSLPDTNYNFQFPEPDGNGGFLKNYWETMDDDV